jgi:hypothetical protein
MKWHFKGLIASHGGWALDHLSVVCPWGLAVITRRRVASHESSWHGGECGAGARVNLAVIIVARPGLSVLSTGAGCKPYAHARKPPRPPATAQNGERC